MAKISMLSNEQWAEGFASFMAAESYKLMKGVSDRKGHEIMSLVLSIYAQEFFKRAVYGELTKRLNGIPTEEQAYEFAAKNFSNIKVSVQESIGKAFSDAMSGFTGKNVEYYCQVSIVPPIYNKEPC